MILLTTIVNSNANQIYSKPTNRLREADQYSPANTPRIVEAK